MKKNYAVDIIIPTYNNLRWIEQTIDSVLAQTYQNFLIFIIDDGSTDGTDKFVATLRDKRIKYIKKSNGGVSSARNLGIASSKSPFVAFLDSDDLWTPDKLEKQIRVMDEHPDVGLVYGSHYVIDDGNIIQRNNMAVKSGWIFDDLVRGNCVTGSASMVLIRRKILKEAGNFREDFINGEDWELWMRVAKIAKVSFVPDILALIRVHDMSAQQSTERMSDALVYAYGVMKKEFELTQSQQRLLASYCLFNSAVTYYHLREYKKARKTLIELLRENPPAYKDIENWKLRFSLGVFSKIMFSFAFFRKLNRIVHIAFGVLRRVFRLFIKVVKKVLRIFRSK